MTSASNIEVVTAFEVNGMTPEEIAEGFEYEVTAVKAILMQNSRVYRREQKTDDKLDFSDNEAAEMKAIILDTARYAEDEHLKFKAARWALEDKKGYLKPERAAAGLQINVIDFNQQMKKALAAEQRTIEIAAKSEVVSS